MRTEFKFVEDEGTGAQESIQELKGELDNTISDAPRAQRRASRYLI